MQSAERYNSLRFPRLCVRPWWRRGSAVMAETEFEYATDNDSDLQYKRMLGSGTYGSVHEVITLPLYEADIDPLHSWEKSSIMSCVKLMVVIRKEITSSPV
jgi:hypothetical protein